MPTPIGKVFKGRSGHNYVRVEAPGGGVLDVFAAIIAGLFLLMGLVSVLGQIPGAIGHLMTFLASSIVLKLVLFVIHWVGLLVIAAAAVGVLWLILTLVVNAFRGRASLFEVASLLAMVAPLAAFAVAHYLIFEHHTYNYFAHPSASHTLVVRFEHVLALVGIPAVLWLAGVLVIYWAQPRTTETVGPEAA